MTSPRVELRCPYTIWISLFPDWGWRPRIRNNISGGRTFTWLWLCAFTHGKRHTQGAPAWRPRISR